MCNNKIHQLLFSIVLKAYSDVEQQQLYTELKDIKVNIINVLADGINRNVVSTNACEGSTVFLYNRIK